jgi:hypothetical protein
MVAATNAGIVQRVFGTKPGENYWANAGGHGPNNSSTYRFTVPGTDIPAIAWVRTDEWHELHIHVALWPTSDAARWIDGISGGGGDDFLAGECEAVGWVERREGAWLQVGSGRPLVHCRRARVEAVSSLTIEPNGYADQGKFYP